MPCSSKLLVPTKFRDQNNAYIFCSPPACYISLLSYPSWFRQHNDIMRTVQMAKLLITLLGPMSRGYGISKYFCKSLLIVPRTHHLEDIFQSVSVTLNSIYSQLSGHCLLRPHSWWFAMSYWQTQNVTWIQKYFTAWLSTIFFVVIFHVITLESLASTLHMNSYCPSGLDLFSVGDQWNRMYHHL
jgi:hypothetical protein